MNIIDSTGAGLTRGNKESYSRFGVTINSNETTDTYSMDNWKLIIAEVIHSLPDFLFMKTNGVVCDYTPDKLLEMPQINYGNEVGSMKKFIHTHIGMKFTCKPGTIVQINMPKLSKEITEVIGHNIRLQVERLLSDQDLERFNNYAGKGEE